MTPEGAQEARTTGRTNPTLTNRTGKLREATLPVGYEPENTQSLTTGGGHLPVNPERAMLSMNLTAASADSVGVKSNLTARNLSGSLSPIHNRTFVVHLRKGMHWQGDARVCFWIIGLTQDNV